MFENDLKARLQRIFDFKKTRYDDPGDSLEQECLFVNIDHAKCKVSDKTQRARVTGQFVVYGSFDKLPFGYFEKQIAKADSEDTVRFFFYETDHSLPMIDNIVRRSSRFVFFYDAQYDPDIGTITDIDIQESETE